ncbi:MAG: SRPBCC family protein [Gulosibacter sp.]|uniref:SRPBCC family protein n=1 Tax=Gulosibacter sp. TaxID=2817531 RepID=UPI003F924359
MKDMRKEIAEAAREVTRRGTGDDELIAVTLRREYPTEAEEIWQAVTDPERLARWFAPVSGDLREGGTFQVEDNADGEIRECTRPTTLTLTWGGPVSIVTVRLTPTDAGTTLELEHTVSVAIAANGAGALYVGPGWDSALVSLALWLRGDLTEDRATWEYSAEARETYAASIDAWIKIIAASGTANDDEIAAATAVSRAQFTPSESQDDG